MAENNFTGEVDAYVNSDYGSLDNYGLPEIYVDDTEKAISLNDPGSPCMYYLVNTQTQQKDMPNIWS